MEQQTKYSKNYATLYAEEKAHWWFQARRDIVSHLFWNTIYKIPSHPSILSIGTSTGAEVEYLSQFGRVTGVDISDQAIEFNQSKGLNVQKMDITQCTFPDNSFDVVFAMDVLEHISDDKTAFAQAIRVLKPGGFIVITVPAFMFLWSEHDVEAEHVRRYTKASLKNILATQNISILTLSYYNFFLFPAMFLARKMKVSIDRQRAVPHTMVNRFFRSIFAAERFVLNKAQFPFGVSLIAVCQKPKTSEVT